MSDEKEEEFKEEDYTESSLPEIEEVLENTSPEIKKFWLSMFLLLNKHERYHEVMEENFDIQKVIDDETQTIDIVIKTRPKIEKTSTVSGAQIMRMHAVLMKYGLQNKATECLKDLQNVLRDRETKSSIVASASDADLKQELSKK